LPRRPVNKGMGIENLEGRRTEKKTCSLETNSSRVRVERTWSHDVLARKRAAYRGPKKGKTRNTACWEVDFKRGPEGDEGKKLKGVAGKRHKEKYRLTGGGTGSPSLGERQPPTSATTRESPQVIKKRSATTDLSKWKGAKKKLPGSVGVGGPVGGARRGIIGLKECRGEKTE